MNDERAKAQRELADYVRKALPTTLISWLVVPIGLYALKSALGLSSFDVMVISLLALVAYAPSMIARYQFLSALAAGHQHTATGAGGTRRALVAFASMQVTILIVVATYFGIRALGSERSPIVGGLWLLGALVAFMFQVRLRKSAMASAPQQFSDQL